MYIINYSPIQLLGLEFRVLQFCPLYSGLNLQLAEYSDSESMYLNSVVFTTLINL